MQWDRIFATSGENNQTLSDGRNPALACSLGFFASTRWRTRAQNLTVIESRWIVNDQESVSFWGENLLTNEHARRPWPIDHHQQNRAVVVG